mgnify:FL=1
MGRQDYDGGFSSTGTGAAATDSNFGGSQSTSSAFDPGSDYDGGGGRTHGFSGEDAQYYNAAIDSLRENPNLSDQARQFDIASRVNPFNEDIAKAYGQFNRTRSSFEPSGFDTFQETIGFDPKKTLAQNLYDTVVPMRNTPLGILSTALTAGTGGLSDAAKYGITLGNYFAGQSEPFMDFLSDKLGTDEAEDKMGTYDFSGVVDEKTTRPEMSPSVQNQVEQAIESTTGAKTGDVTREGIMEALGVPADTPQTQFGEPVDTSFFDTQTNVFGNLSAPLEFVGNNLMKKGNVYTSGSSGGVTGRNRSSGMTIGKLADSIGDVIGYGYYRDKNR